MSRATNVLHCLTLGVYNRGKPRNGSGHKRNKIGGSGAEKNPEKQKRQKTERVLEIWWAQGRTPRFRFYIKKSDEGQGMTSDLSKLPKLEPVKFPKQRGSTKSAPKTEVKIGKPAPEVIAEIQRLSKKGIYVLDK